MRATLIAVALGVLGVLTAPAHAGLVHDFQLNETLADSLPTGAVLVSHGGTVGATEYSFGEGQGLSLSDPDIDGETYSVEMRFRFDETSGFRRILEFKDLAADTGLYNLSGALNFFSEDTGADIVFTPDAYVTVLLTRDGTTKQVIGYVNGVEQISFVDTTDLAVFDAADRIMQFFRDDNQISGEESAGAVDFIRIFDTVETPAAVPEPASLALVGTAGLAFALRSIRRRKAGR